MTIIIPMPVYRSSPPSGGYSSYGSHQDPVLEEYEHLPVGALFAFVYHTGEKDSLLGMTNNWVAWVHRRTEHGAEIIRGSVEVAHTRKGVEKCAREMMYRITHGTQRGIIPA